MTKKDPDERTKTAGPAGSRHAAGIDSDPIGMQVHRGDVVATVAVVEGPGTGATFPIYQGDNAIGRGLQNQIALNFGDEAIHREAHAFIQAVDSSLVLQHGGKSNPVHVNGKRIDGICAVDAGDRIKVGSTTLQIGAK